MDLYIQFIFMIALVIDSFVIFTIVSYLYFTNKEPTLKEIKIFLFLMLLAVIFTFILAII